MNQIKKTAIAFAISIFTTAAQASAPCVAQNYSMQPIHLNGAQQYLAMISGAVPSDFNSRTTLLQNLRSEWAGTCHQAWADRMMVNEMLQNNAPNTLDVQNQSVANALSVASQDQDPKALIEAKRAQFFHLMRVKSRFMSSNYADHKKTDWASVESWMNSSLQAFQKHSSGASFDAAIAKQLMFIKAHPDNPQRNVDAALAYGDTAIQSLSKITAMEQAMENTGNDSVEVLINEMILIEHDQKLLASWELEKNVSQKRFLWPLIAKNESYATTTTAQADLMMNPLSNNTLSAKIKPLAQNLIVLRDSNNIQKAVPVDVGSTIKSNQDPVVNVATQAEKTAVTTPAPRKIEPTQKPQGLMSAAPAQEGNLFSTLGNGLKSIFNPTSQTQARPTVKIERGTASNYNAN